MQRNFVILFLLFLMSCGFRNFKGAVDGQLVDESILTKKQSKIIFRNSQDLPNQTQIAIAIIEGGDTKFYGVKRENDTIFTVENHESVFEIGSISKVFTSTLLADFALNQKLELDHPINDYIKWPLKGGVEITFKQLANHTSGLPRLPSNLNLLSVDLKNPYKDYDETKLEIYITEKLKLNSNPGEKFEYSNLGAGLLGFILAELDTTTYEALLRSKIFSKYQMTHSTTNRKLVEHKLVVGLNADGKETPNWDLNVLAGAGCILSSVRDLSKFAQAQFDQSNEVLSLTRKSTFQDNKMNIGLGWIIKTKPVGERIWHNGGTGGYTSTMQVDVENKNAVIVLSNVSGLSRKRVNIESICDQLMDTLE